MSPKLSIIVPVYKVEKYLSPCLDSIAKQTLTDWECLLIDDGSPDNSGAICDEYASRDSRFKVIHKENGGPSAARNAGLKIAQGKYIGFVDSDDWIESDMFEILIKTAEDENAEITCCDYFMEFQDKSIVTRMIPKKSGKECARELLNQKLRGMSWLKIIQRDFAQKYQLLQYDENIANCEDDLFSLKLYYYANKIAYVPKPLYHYRQLASSIVHTPSKKFFDDVIYVVTECEDFLKQHLDYNDFKSSIQVLKMKKKFVMFWINELDFLKDYRILWSDSVKGVFKINVPIYAKVYLYFLTKGHYKIAYFIKNQLKVFMKKIIGKKNKEQSLYRE